MVMKEKKEYKSKKQQRKVELLGIENADDWDDINDADAPADTADADTADANAADADATDAAGATTDAGTTADTTDAVDPAADTDDTDLDDYAEVARAMLHRDAAADTSDDVADTGTTSATDGNLPDLDPDLQAMLDQTIADAEARHTSDKLDFTDAIGGCCFDHSKKGGNTMNVKNLDFYNALGASALDFDRGMPMSSDLRDWIMAAIASDEELATDSLQRLGELLENHPKLTGAVRAIVDKVEENSIPYFAAWRSKIDGKLYVCRETAERAIDHLVKSGVTDFNKVYTVEYCAYTDEEPGYETVDTTEVVNFVQDYKGDRERLMRKLFIPTTPKPQQDSAKGDKPDKKSDKKDNKKSDKDDQAQSEA